MRQAFYRGIIHTAEGSLRKHAVLVDGYDILGIVPENQIPEGFELINVQGKHIAPGLIDLQVYGGNGQLFSVYPQLEALQAMEAYCKQGGALYFQPTIATNRPELMWQACDAFRAYRAAGGQAAIGVHWEGPFIHPQKRGAHIESLIRTLTQQDVEMMTEQGSDVITMLTLAPERCQLAHIQALVKAGLHISAGHSLASYDQAMEAFTKGGISLATHLFNAMSPLLTREPGLVGAIFDHPEVYASIIADGIHVHPAAIRIAHSVMKGRLFLITDAVEQNQTGDYVYLRAGDRYVNQQGVLAGSTLTMLKAVAYCVQQVGISLDEALRMASWYPAKAIGMDDRIGKLAPGYRSGAIVFDDDFQLIYRSV
ncbi:MAG: N-acetylglucosamine-6-phosphate deacetylase [Thermoflavifilum sp.]|nr:N-acetylglucosamine-6-phosphate deacetylase [Thermoflavifilum sp.]